MALQVSDWVTSPKVNAAAILREEIITGRLQPGEPIVESTWAVKLKVGRGSLREAISKLVSEGFIQKESGQSACVTVLTELDVARGYEVRRSLECLAARLAAVKRADMSGLDQAIEDMRSSVRCGNFRAYAERDVGFHLLLCEKSDNPILLGYVRRIIVPFFAFIVIRVHAAITDPARWEKSIQQHSRILQAIRSGDPDLAEREVGAVFQDFSEETNQLLAQL